MQEENIEEELTIQNILQTQGLIPQVFDGYHLHLTHPFNTVTIHLDGKLLSHLDWDAPRQLALGAVEKGYAIFWHLELGLFDHLNLPLANQTQFLSLALSLEHFKNSLLKEFTAHSVGISIYRGQADFSLDFIWCSDQVTNLRAWLQEHFSTSDALHSIIQDQNLENLQPGNLYTTNYGKTLLALFCRDVCVEYLSLLASKLPDTLPCYLFLDATSLSQDHLKLVQLLNPDRFQFLHLALKGTSLPLGKWGWHSHATPEGYVGAMIKKHPADREIKIGICLPLMHYYLPKHWKNIDQILNHLIQADMPFKLISENQLITQWDGLDFLFYNPEGLSPQGKRKLLGFCAAGGEVISLGELLGLPYEKSLSTWLEEPT